MNFQEHEFNIVVIDDMRSNVNLIVESLRLRNKNFIFNTFTEGLKGFEYISQNINKIDIVILDIIMPDITGLEVCKKIRALDEQIRIPVILITAKTDCDDILEGFNAGADDYITKPFNSKELNARVSAFLKNRAMQKHLEIQNEELKKLNNLKDTFLSIASHDIRNNLTGIIGHTHLILMQKFGTLNSKYLQSLKIILKRSKNISNQVDNIIDASKLEEGKLVLNLAQVDFKDFINQYYNDIVALYIYEDFNFLLEFSEITEVFVDI